MIESILNDIVTYVLFPFCDIGTLLNMSSVNHYFYQMSNNDVIFKIGLENELLSFHLKGKHKVDVRAIKVPKLDASSFEKPEILYDKEKHEILTYKRRCIEVFY